MSDPISIIKQFKANSRFENALNEHRRKFKPHMYGLDRRNFVDPEAAFMAHMATFDHSSIPRHHYDVTPKGLMEHDEAISQARQEHASDFDPSEWSHLDHVLRPDYFDALQQAHDDHDSKFQYDSSQDAQGDGQ